MSVVVLPNTIPEWDWIVQWPYPEPLAVPTDITIWNRSMLLVPGMHQQSVPRPALAYSQGGTGVVEVVDKYQGVVCLHSRTTSAVIVNGLGVRTMPVTTINALAPGYVNPSWRRVSWFTWTMAFDSLSGNIDENDGMLFLPFNTFQTADRWPVLGTSAGFGVVGNPAGGWQWASYGVGAFPGNRIELVPLAIADPENFHQFDMVIISGAPGREASCELWVDGSAVLNRSWVAAPMLPAYGFSVTTDFSFQPVFRVANNILVFRLDWTFRNGRFLPDGRELLT